MLQTDNVCNAASSPVNRPVKELMDAAMVNPIVGVTSSIIAAVWQHTIAATSVPPMQALSKGRVVANVGPAATALVWWTVLSMVTGMISFKAGIYVEILGGLG